MFNKSAILAAVCAALAPAVSAYTVTYSAYPNTTVPLACPAPPSSSGTFNTGTSGAPVCHNIAPAAFYGNFTLQSTAPVGCVLHTFSGTGCTGTEGPLLNIPVTLVPGVSSGCTPIEPLRLLPLPPTLLSVASVEVNCPSS
ncbi:unnamed protein product [Peniophora sp. CBMAI 1063]|nr:unnamed protein product [Peniophora sp. CBMAI 1063]